MDEKPVSATPETDAHLIAWPMVSDNDVANFSAIRSFVNLTRSLETRLRDAKRYDTARLIVGRRVMSAPKMATDPTGPSVKSPML